MYIWRVVRTQIYLPEVLHRALTRAAAKRGVSMAELIRDAAESAVNDTGELVDPLEDITGLRDKGPADMSARHDQYLARPSRKRSKR